MPGLGMRENRRGATNALLARLIQDWLGHRKIQHTSHYTDGISARFKGIWD
jgi:hypothetical protein